MTLDADTDGGSILEGALNILEALGGQAGEEPKAKAKRADADVIDVEAKVVEDVPPPPRAAAPAPTVEARQANGRPFLPSDLAAPLYRLLRAVELLNQDATAARAAGTLSDRTATAWVQWRAGALEWARDVADGDYPHDDPGAVLAEIKRRWAKLPRWRAYLERESGRRAAHSRGTMGAVAKAEKPPGVIDGLPFMWKLGIGLGLAWGAVKVVPRIIDALADPFGGSGG